MEKRIITGRTCSGISNVNCQKQVVSKSVPSYVFTHENDATNLNFTDLEKCSCDDEFHDCVMSV